MATAVGNVDTEWVKAFFDLGEAGQERLWGLLADDEKVFVNSHQFYKEV